jgi:hypothetical protein
LCTAYREPLGHIDLLQELAADGEVVQDRLAVGCTQCISERCPNPP